MTSPYDTLGVSRTASRKAIQSAYRKLAKTCHPDLHPGDMQKSAQFIALTEAYETLADDTRRRSYDERHFPREEPMPPPERNTTMQPPRMHIFSALDNAYSRRDFSEEIARILLIVAGSPVTYCVLVVILMLAALKAGMNSMHAPHVVRP